MASRFPFKILISLTTMGAVLGRAGRGRGGGGGFGDGGGNCSSESMAEKVAASPNISLSVLGGGVSLGVVASGATAAVGSCGEQPPQRLVKMRRASASVFGAKAFWPVSERVASSFIMTTW